MTTLMGGLTVGGLLLVLYAVVQHDAQAPSTASEAQIGDEPFQARDALSMTTRDRFAQ